jgi:hypothetical protein
VGDLAQLDVADARAGFGRTGLTRYPPHASQELNGRVGVDVRPVDIVLGRAGEDHRQPDRVDPVPGQLLPQVDAVAQRLGHRPALVDHLALVQLPRERLDEVHHAHVVQDLDEEPGVQQVQDGVLDPADVQVHRRPAAHRLDVERPVLVVR